MSEIERGDSFIPKCYVFTEFHGNCGSIMISLLRSNDKRHVGRGLDQSVIPDALALSPGGNCVILSFDGLWQLLPGCGA